MSLLLFADPAALFVRVRKTGSTSVVQGFWGGGDKAVDRSEGAFKPEWADRFCFGFVRNPYDRLASCLTMFRSYPVADADEEALRARLSIPLLLDVIADEAWPFVGETFAAKLRQHALPMSHPSYHLDRAHFVGRFESFAADYRAVAERLGLGEVAVPHFRRRRGELDRRGFFDAASRRRAEAVLGPDLERFGYDFDA